MKRTHAGLRNARSVDVPEGEQGFWPSFADMMSSFALIMFFLMLISYLQNLITGNRLISTESLLQETEEVLQETEETLHLTEEEAEEKAARLILLQGDLLTVQATLTEQENLIAGYTQTIDWQTAELERRAGLLAEQDAKLGEQEAALLEQEATMKMQAATLQEQEAALASQKAALSEQASTLSEQEGTINAQKEYIALTTEELTKLRGQMENIAYLRLSVLNTIKDNIEQSLGDGSTVTIGESGSLILSDGMLFDKNKYDVKPESYLMLDRLTMAFYNFLSKEENRNYVDSIVIAGHTDSTGSAEKNRTLSANRANAVLTYLLEGNGGILSEYAGYFCAAGYGLTRPVADNSTAEGMAQNRRIEISIILKDKSVLDIVDTYLETEIPQ